MADVSALEKELTGLRDELKKLEGKGVKSADELVPVQDKLRAIDSKKVDGKFVDAKGEIPPGQAKLSDLLAECYEIKERITDKLG